MKPRSVFLAILCGFAAVSSPASVLFVDLKSANPTPPYTDWSTAATNIQDAVDASSDGDLILVTDGIYQTGGQVVYGSLTNRVAINKAVTVQSVNGPAATIIQGYQDVSTVNGDDAVRCVYMTNNAVLSGFTLFNGATRAGGDGNTEQSGGGAWCESTNAVITNCVITANAANDSGGGVASGTLSDCTVSINTSAGDGGGAAGSVLNGCSVNGNTAAFNGGGTTGCTLNDCVLTTNVASGYNGGGATGSTLDHCTLTGNYAGSAAGGAFNSTLTNCLLTGNAVGYGGAGGGAYGSELDRCTLIGNTATNNGYGYGGGGCFCTANDSLFTGNRAAVSGGGAMYGTLNNCTVVGNSAGTGGGAGDCNMNNCIVYYNTSPDGENYTLDGEVGGILNYCCIPDLPPAADGTGNITNEPQLADIAHISATSPCLGAGSSNYTTGVDIDGEPWRNPPSIGCDEFYSGAITGTLIVAAQADFTNLATGFAANFAGTLLGHASYNVWDFGDGTLVSNRLYLSHSWTAAGDYSVTFTAFNDDNPGGVSVMVTVHVLANPIHFVSLDSTNPVAPYFSWATAATNIQDAVDAAFVGGTVLVSNGVFAAGGRVVYGSLTNCVAVTKPLTLISVNGPGATIIQGYQDTNSIVADDAVRCVYLTNNAVLSGFTLTNGATRANGDANTEQSGGGIWCESTNVVITNCVITANEANNEGGGIFSGTIVNSTVANNLSLVSGGGAAGCVMSNCILTGNTADYDGDLDGVRTGGGVINGLLVNCILTNNFSGTGGGAETSTLNNCTLINNGAWAYGGGADSSTLTNCALTSNEIGVSSAPSLVRTAQSKPVPFFIVPDAGGGAENSTLNNCQLISNQAIGYSVGGGVDSSTLDNCVLLSNSADDSGGGANNSTLNNCALTSNNASYGGGAEGSILNNCLVAGNSAQSSGGGAEGSTLDACVVTNNSVVWGVGGGVNGSTATDSLFVNNSANAGGGAEGGSLTNCTLVDNYCNEGAWEFGGGADGSSLYDCILYFNNGDNDNYNNSTLNYCCTTPLPAGGAGNITNAPLFVNLAGDDFHLQTNSPCINTGDNDGVTDAVDLDGNPRIYGGVVDMGAYEFQSFVPFTDAIQLDFAHVTPGFAANFQGTIYGQVYGPATSNVWDFGDGTIVSDVLSVSHQWTVPGNYLVTFTAFNTNNPGGIQTTIDVTVTTQLVYYVDANNTTPVAPYDSWSTAATNIQDAVDAAFAGGTILVNNGVYNAGGRVVYGALTNRVAVTIPLTVESINGPAATIIQGYQVPITINDDAAVRCVYLTNGAMLSGFTLTNGATRAAGDGILEQSGGGVWCESTNVVVTNCVIVGCTAAVSGGGAYDGTFYQSSFTQNSVAWSWNSGGGATASSVLNQCALFNNSAASYGGAVDTSTLNGCSLMNNSASYGGAAHSSTLINCLATNNYAIYVGGGGYGCTFSNCTLTGNTSSQGGGACGSELDNCRLIGNCVTNNETGWDGILGDGGGAQDSRLNNCSLTGNTAEDSGGAVSYCTLNNCTLTGNTSTNTGGGSDFNCTLNNCIVYYNNAPNGANYSGGAFNNSCTTPMPSGANNITAEPLLADAAHITAASPCLGAGSTNYSGGVDIDGEPWRNPPSIGCDEYYSGTITGALTVAIQASHTNVAAAFTVNFIGTISGHAGYNVWNFGDGTVVSNQLYLSHVWASAGNYPVTLTAFNNDNPGGVSTTVTIFILEQPVHYVNAAGINPVAPYLSWATAATNIQDAVDAAFVGGTVLVTNGIYLNGGRGVNSVLTNRIVVTRPLIVKSVNGPAVTVIQGNPARGDSAVRCAYLGISAVLEGFTLAKGATRNAGDAGTEQGGGGVWCENNSVVVSNCWLTGNSAVTGGGAYQGALDNCELFENSANNGGGASYSVLDNCAVAGNSAIFAGGGAEGCTLNNCTVTANSATDTGGGADASMLNNCIAFYNSAATQSNYNNCTLNFSCTTPLPADGVSSNNITLDPQLIDTAHLKSWSPCIGAGGTNYSSGVDIDGEPWANPPSIGCDEYSPGAAGALGVAISADYTNAAAGFTVNFLGLIHGHAGETVWNFGDGTIVTNQLMLSHGWTSAGNYQVVLTAFNDDNPGGVSTTDMVFILEQPTYYVSIRSASPVPPYTSWATAATNIQDAVDAAIPSGIILVSNGVYQTGGRLDVRTDLSTNRVVVAKPLVLMSVNGPSVTIIQGNPVVDPTGVRCIYLTNNAALMGFTLTQGATRNDGDGGRDQPGGGAWCESTSVVISNCFLIGNFAMSGAGGAYRGTLDNCVISNNSGAVLTYYGSGGGADSAILNNCLVINNSAGWSGGGAESSTLNNCTIVSNSVAFFGNGVNNCTLNNCISYHNNGEDNYSGSTLNYCCTTPDPGGIGNITNDPWFMNPATGDYHLRPGSACIDAGNNAYVTTAADLDGNPRVFNGTVDIGAYEFHTPDQLLVEIQTSFTNVAAGFTVNVVATVYGHSSLTILDFGDGTTVTNQLTASHVWNDAGSYPVTVTAFNAGNPAGVSATVNVQVSDLVYYVSQDSTNPVAPYNSWFTATTNLQAAADTALAVPGALVVVSNGIYSPVTVTKPLTLRSVNGPALTFIDGTNGSPCVYLASNSILAGFTLTNGNAYWSGGGVTCESTNVIITNSVISGNSAGYGAGGVAGGTLENCLITGNSSAFGGGANSSILINCTIANNSAYTGAGADGCTLENCTVTGNNSSGGGGFQGGGGLHGSVAVGCNIYGNAAIFGGGASDSTLTFCTVSNNDGWNYGGGVIGSTLDHCVVIGNTGAISGGGAESSILNNCLVADNTSWDSIGGADSSALTNCTIAGSSCFYGNLSGAGSCTLANCILYDNANGNYSSCTLNYCCTTPLPAGTGNFTNDPAFVNLAGDDFHLQTNSPCINSGNNAFVSVTNDLDGNPRIVVGTVDAGAYEFQNPASGISYAWLQQYGLPTDGSADYADTDGTGMNNWQKWIAGLDPTNPASVLAMLAPVATGDSTGLTVTWQSVSTRMYYLQSSTDLSAQPPFTTIQSNIVGQAGTTSYTDTTATNSGPYFYRVGVQ
jgi:PKD repeat protein